MDTDYVELVVDLKFFWMAPGQAMPQVTEQQQTPQQAAVGMGGMQGTVCNPDLS